MFFDFTHLWFKFIVFVLRWNEYSFLYFDSSFLIFLWVFINLNFFWSYNSGDSIFGYLIIHIYDIDVFGLWIGILDEHFLCNEFKKNNNFKYFLTFFICCRISCRLILILEQTFYFFFLKHNQQFKKQQLFGLEYHLVKKLSRSEKNKKFF